MSASLNLNRNSLNEKLYFIASSTLKTNVVNQKVCKKKYLSWVNVVDRKIRHLGSLFGITQQAS